MENSTKPPPQNQAIPIKTPQEDYKNTTTQIQDYLLQSTGEKHDVEPVTPDSTLEFDTPNIKEGDSIDQFYLRVVENKPGSEPAKSFLKRLLDRIKKKNPGKEVKLS